MSVGAAVEVGNTVIADQQEAEHGEQVLDILLVMQQRPEEFD